MNTLFPMTRVLDAAFNNCAPSHVEGEAQTTVTPRADVLEGDKEFRVMIDLPGVNHDGLDISVEDQTLTVKAGRQDQVPDGFRSRRHERYGQVNYARTFNLGNIVDIDGIGAAFNDGVLTITLPKSDKSLPRRIEVQ